MILDKDIDQLMQQNQSGFDKQPSGKAWEVIGGALQEAEIKQKSAEHKKWFAAASILLFAGLSFFMYNQLTSNKSMNSLAESTAPLSEGESLSLNSHPIPENTGTSGAVLTDKDLSKNEPVSTSSRMETFSIPEEKKPLNEYPKAEVLSMNAPAPASSTFNNEKKEAVAKPSVLAKVLADDEKTAAFDIVQQQGYDAKRQETAIQQEEFAMASSKMSAKKEKAAIAKSRQTHVVDYYAGIWQSKAPIENTAGVIIDDKVALVFDQNNAVYLHGLDKKTIPFAITELNELHMSLSNLENQEVKISYLSSREALLVFTNQNGKTSVVLRKN